VAHWVGLNTNRVSDSSHGGDCFCNDCEREFPFGSTVDCEVPIEAPSSMSDDFADGVRLAIDLVSSEAEVHGVSPSAAIHLVDALCQVLRDAGHEP
jgi:hypothetical protein